MFKSRHDGGWFIWTRENGDIVFVAYPNHYLQKYTWRTKITFQKDLAAELGKVFGKHAKVAGYKDEGNRVTITAPYAGSGLQESDQRKMWRSRLYARRPLRTRR